MPDNTLLTLPKELFLKHMTFDNHAVNQLALTCKFFSFFRKNATGKGGAYLLMEHVLSFNLKAARQFAQINPDSMFEQINYQFTDGAEIISPLQQSFRSLDSYMWKMFLKIAEKNPKHLKKFQYQMQSKMDYFDIRPLLSVYDEHLKKFYEISNAEKINKMDEDIKNNILITTCSKIGLEQAKLPLHMLYEMFRLGEAVFNYISEEDEKKIPFTREDCSEILTWYEHKFNVDTNKPPLRNFICCFEEETGVEFYSACDIISQLKNGDVAVRGDYSLGAYMVISAGRLMETDKKAFEALYLQREKEYEEQLLLFKGQDKSPQYM